MRYVRTHVRTHTVHTDKFSIEHTSVGLAHARPINRFTTHAVFPILCTTVQVMMSQAVRKQLVLISTIFIWILSESRFLKDTLNKDTTALCYYPNML